MDRLIKGTHHVSIKCKDMDEFQKEIKFYTETLGMLMIRTWRSDAGFNAMINTGNSILEFSTSGKVSDVTGPLNHLALATDDVDLCVEKVRNAGYEVTIEPKDIVIKSCPEYPARIAFVKAPAGELIEFFCER